ncbi:MAG: fluoride efflux transporter CrcB [Chloroflexota bacterium]|nr:fluoride efflux transporter CrcB [Chloroflexota bacterium]
MEIVWVAVGGMVGAVSRHGVSRLAADRWGGELPFGTFVVNMTGGFAIGLVLTVLAGRVADPAWRLLLVTGFLGGYTTFSAFSYELAGMLTNGRLGWAAAYLVASNLLGVMACLAGIICARPFAR